MEAGGQVASEGPGAPRLELTQSLVKRLLRLAERWAQNTLGSVDKAESKTDRKRKQNPQKPAKKKR